MAAFSDLGANWRSGAVDVHYSDEGGATAALVVCGEAALAMVLDEHVANVHRVAPYEPGALFKREFPCIRAVMALNGPLDLLVVDGYATLGPGEFGPCPGSPVRAHLPAAFAPFLQVRALCA